MKLLKILFLFTIMPGFVFSPALAQVSELTGEDVHDAIEWEFMTEKAIPANDIDTEVSNGVVTLDGTVDHIMAKKRAAKVAGAVKGVRSVVNQIRVETLLPVTDTELESNVTQALTLNPATDAYEVSVQADENVVTLDGYVESYQEKTLAAKVARSVDGVEALVNNLNVNFAANRSDEEIEKEIMERLRWDTRVDHALVTVNVNDGIVTLDGVVGSATEKNQAHLDAWVAGVSDVMSDNLNVEKWAREDNMRTNKYADKSDEEIHEAVKAAFAYDPRVASGAPTVKVDNGSVTLSGVVDNLPAKQAAEQDAMNTVGVWRVRSNLKVRPADMPNDDRLSTSVDQSLMMNPYTESYEIGVSANQGTIYLTGVVDNNFEKNEAQRVASNVRGVIEVVNMISTTDAITPDDVVVTTDKALRQEVRDQLFWSPFVNLYEVNIEVEDGIATLTGTVDTFKERQEATQEAMEAGVYDVKNRLKVNYDYLNVDAFPY